MLTLQQNEILSEAQLLHDAERNRRQTTATTTRYPSMTIDDAYAIQAAWIDLKKAEGRSVAGYKIGLTSRTMQKSMNINEPDYGTLMDDMILEEGTSIEAATFLDPRLEMELAFFLKKPLVGENISVLDVLNATDFVMPAVELIAARTFRIDPTTKYVRTVRDTISDNAANGAIILGGKPIKPQDADLRWLGAMLFKNGVLEETGLAAGVLNHPAKGVAWLAKKYAQHGIELGTNMPILSGSFTSPVVAKAGDTFHFDYGKLGSFGICFR